MGAGCQRRGGQEGCTPSSHGGLQRLGRQGQRLDFETVPQTKRTKRKPQVRFDKSDSENVFYYKILRRKGAFAKALAGVLIWHAWGMILRFHGRSGEVVFSGDEQISGME